MEFDIIFISYDESNADENWSRLTERFPWAQRVHGIKGIRQAHIAAAETSRTPYFFVVDGDNRIRPDFNFQPPMTLKENTLYVWRCHNPANHLVYGYGAIKLYNKSLVQRRYKKEKLVDLATSVTEHYHIMHQVASETHFFNTPFEAWRGAFRECAKLSSGLIQRQKDDETRRRLSDWCNVGHPVDNIDWVLLGANQGKAFGEDPQNELSRVNDFSWLRERFNASHQ
jgi:hypothetical protein